MIKIELFPEQRTIRYRMYIQLRCFEYKSNFTTEVEFNEANISAKKKRDSVEGSVTNSA